MKRWALLLLLNACSPADRAAMRRGACEANGDIYCAMDADRDLADYRERDCRRYKRDCVRDCQENTDRCGDGWSEEWERCIRQEPRCVRSCENDYIQCL